MTFPGQERICRFLHYQRFIRPAIAVLCSLILHLSYIFILNHQWSKFLSVTFFKISTIDREGSINFHKELSLDFGDATKDLENRMLKATLEMLNKQKMETLQQVVMAPMQDAEKWMPTVTMEQLINMKSEMQQWGEMMTLVFSCSLLVLFVIFLLMSWKTEKKIKQQTVWLYCKSRRDRNYKRSKSMF